MSHADSEVESHIVGVVESREEREVRDMAQVHHNACKGPQRMRARVRTACFGFGWTVSLGRIEVKQTDDGVIHGVEDG